MTTNHRPSYNLGWVAPNMLTVRGTVISGRSKSHTVSATYKQPFCSKIAAFDDMSSADARPFQTVSDRLGTCCH